VIPQIVALPLDQVERDQRHPMIVTAGAQRVEIAQPVVSANHGFPIDQKRLRPDRAGDLDDGAPCPGFSASSEDNSPGARYSARFFSAVMFSRKKFPIAAGVRRW